MISIEESLDYVVDDIKSISFVTKNIQWYWRHPFPASWHYITCRFLPYVKMKESGRLGGPAGAPPMDPLMGSATVSHKIIS